MELLDNLEGVKFLDFNHPDYRKIYNKTARSVYKTVTGCQCPCSINWGKDTFTDLDFF